MKIALIQQKVTKDLEGNLNRARSALTQAAENGAQLVAFPELAFLPFLPQKPATSGSIGMAEPVPGPTTRIFCQLAKEHRVAVVLNLFEASESKTYDSSPVIDSDGSLLGVVRMAHIMEGQGFFEKGYYNPAEHPVSVFDTEVGRIGVAICYDRHFPEYMRALGLLQPDVVIIPQAGVSGEWPEGIFEAEIQVAAFQNGYFAALANRVGQEDILRFSGESFVVNPLGQIIAQSPQGKDHILYADCDLSIIPASPARKFFIPDRRSDYDRLFNINDRDK